MRCPKCQYLSFDNGDRCRNCGYEFSLAVNAAPLDLAIQDGTEPIGPLADLTLHGTSETEPASPRPADEVPDPSPDTGGFELPLFTPGVRVDKPLVAPASPRAPLSVRRATPQPPKPKAAAPQRSARQTIDEPRLALDTAEMPVVPEPHAHAHAHSHAAPHAHAHAQPHALFAAPVPARALAAVIDFAIVGGIDAAVFYLTLRVLEMHVADARALPFVPFIAFLLLLNGSYFAAFVAASGQTIGKMAAGIRVIPADPVAHATERVSLGTAIVRAAAYIVSALPAGLGFLPGVIGKDHRALHDRLADTRVVKA